MGYKIKAASKENSVTIQNAFDKPVVTFDCDTSDGYMGMTYYNDKLFAVIIGVTFNKKPKRLR